MVIKEVFEHRNLGPHQRSGRIRFHLQIICMLTLPLVGEVRIGLQKNGQLLSIDWPSMALARSS